MLPVTAGQAEQAATRAEALVLGVSGVIEGKDEEIRLAVTGLLAEAHLLVEDVPGVGKTMLARALARCLEASVSRIQFTPDLLPSDITGVSVFQQHSGTFEFMPGAVFAQIVIADEINRASPRTQSALLEAMQERRVSVDGRTLRLPRPFIVIATQNPEELAGTYPLPEAQRDRFGLSFALGYPDHAAEVAMLEHHGEADPLEQVEPVVSAAEVVGLIDLARQVYTHPSIRDYLVRLVDYTRRHRGARIGASPRASLQLLRLAKARALLAGRHFVLPDDVQSLAPAALSHRILATDRSRAEGQGPARIIASALAEVAVPRVVTG